MDFFNNPRIRKNFFTEPQPTTGFGGIDTTGLFNIPPPTISPQTTKQPTNPYSAPDSNIAALRARARPYMNQYQQMLEEDDTTRTNTKTNKLGTALAAVSGILEGAQKGGAHGVDTFNKIRDTNYNRDMAKRQYKMGKLKELAGVEDVNIKEEKELEVAIAADEAKRRDDIRQDMLANSTMDLNDARVQKLIQDGQLAGLSYQKNEITGDIELFDMKTQTATPVKKMNESVAEKQAREDKTFKDHFGIEQGGRREMAGIDQANRLHIVGLNQAHDRFMEGLRTNNDEKLARVKSTLERLSPTQRVAAFKGATDEVLLTYPDLKDQLFTTNENGDLVLKKTFDPAKDGKFDPEKHYNPAVYNIYNNAVQETMRQVIGAPSQGMSYGQGNTAGVQLPAGNGNTNTGNPNQAPGVAPAGRDAALAEIATYKNSPYANQAPAVVDPTGIAPSLPVIPGVDPNIVAMAAAELRAPTQDSPYGYEVSPESVAEWIKQNPQALNQSPQVTVPSQATPDIGMEAFKRIPGAIRDSISYGNLFPTAPNVQQMDPNSDAGLAAIRNMNEAARRRVQEFANKYGPANRSFTSGTTTGY